MELRDGAAEGVAVHAELLGSLALVAAVRGEYLQNEALFELTDGFVVSDTTGMHLADQAVQLAFHKVLFLGYGPNLGAGLFVQYSGFSNAVPVQMPRDGRHSRESAVRTEF